MHIRRIGLLRRGWNRVAVLKQAGRADHRSLGRQRRHAVAAAQKGAARQAAAPTSRLSIDQALLALSVAAARYCASG